jgi:hypothetical protein
MLEPTEAHGQSKDWTELTKWESVLQRSKEHVR